MSILEALILGIIQGLTEFLPVSSSGHLELGKAILGDDLEAGESMLFTIALHGATALSTVVVFRKDIAELFKGLFEFKWNESTKFAAFIVVSMVPVFFVGVLLKDEIELLFEGNLLLVGCSLIFTALLLYSTTRIPAKEGKVTFGKALLIGVSQAIAVLPGVSRSGSTISTALLTGVSRERAARFSFLMVLPVIFGAMILEYKDFVEEGATQNIDTLVLLTGFIAAFVSGILACQWMIALVKKSKLDYFAYYCLLVGAIAIGYSLFA
ncbi:MAG: undecaprenyl-diphosphate phosphatase [Bacteroidota bacterium]